VAGIPPTAPDSPSLPARQNQPACQFPRVAAHLGVACRHERHAALVVAKNLGHTDTRMVERHYGHLVPNYVADAVRAGAPKFGFAIDTTVTPLQR
jgi:hypothetical protein